MVLGVKRFLYFEDSYEVALFVRESLFQLWEGFL